MSSRKRKEGSTLTIVEAVETLSSIAEMDIDRELLPSLEEFDSQSTNYKMITFELLQNRDVDETVDVVKETFRVILNYLRSYYKKQYKYSPNQQTTEGIKAIMVLVGEAAKKLDKYTDHSHKKYMSITELKEYKHLQEFYLSRIARKIDESVLSKWILALAQRAMSQKQVVEEKVVPASRIMQSKHIFVDLEAVKKDSEYELFFIRKVDGSRFYSSRLIRNIKLVCDFGDRMSEMKRDDPLESIKIWYDKTLKTASANILRHVVTLMQKFYQTNSTANHNELGICLNKALMALKLCNNLHNIFHDSSVKNCSHYFLDFQNFLREALHTREYQKMIAYPEEDLNASSKSMCELTQALCRGLFLHTNGLEEVRNTVMALLQEANQYKSQEHMKAMSHNNMFWSHIGADYAAMTAFIKRHQAGPLIKVLESLEEGMHTSFDPLLQDNIPSRLYDIDISNNHIKVIHIPSPTQQEYIDKVVVVEEFKEFLRSLASEKGQNKHLMFNLQDRTSWKENVRCVALEELQNHEDFEKRLAVVTLPKDTQFYYQETPYNLDNHVDVFIQNFKKQLSDEDAGFYFPNDIKEALFPDFVDGLLSSIHKVFFGNKNVLSLDARLEFIDIFYLFLELKIMELVKPTSVSFSCKDGIDYGVPNSAEMYALLRLLHEEHLSKHDLEQMALIIYGPSLLVRERLIRSENFKRMQNMIKLIEHVRDEHGWKEFLNKVDLIFGHFYEWDLKRLNAS